MAQNESPPTGPDFSKGIAAGDIADGGMVAGHVGGDPVLMVRRGNDFFALDALCTHYHAPLADGLVVNDTVRCPWHHACFDLRTGEALRPPAFSPLGCWTVEQRDGRVRVTGRRAAAPARRLESPAPERIVIVGGGAAGFAAAEQLRREGYAGSVTMLSDDDAPPVDRPNLSKDYLAGTSPEDWVPLQPPEFYRDQRIDLRLSTLVTGIDTKSRQVLLAGSEPVPFDRLLLATGAEPIRLPIPGAALAHVHTLRTLKDSRSIIRQAGTARRVVVIGASFIGLEAAAALRTRKLEVHVVDSAARPMERVFGPELGDFVRSLHEEHGVIFHMGDTTTGISEKKVRLASGTELDADLVVIGVGVRPRLALATQAGLRVDRGVIVNEFLETSAPGIYAAGDIARWPDPRSGELIRVEHWAVAERQGQCAALNMLGRRQKYTAVPFFWSQHYDVQINYVGHAAGWERLEIDGSIPGKDCLVRYLGGGWSRAVASIFRDVASLEAEVAMERTGT